MPDQQVTRANPIEETNPPGSLVLLVDRPTVCCRQVDLDRVGKAQSPPSPDKRTVGGGLDMSGHQADITPRLQALLALNVRIATNRDTTGIVVAP
jgi:hypothetical protein